MDISLIQKKIAGARDKILAGKAGQGLKKLESSFLWHKTREIWGIVKRSDPRDIILKLTYLPFIGWIPAMAYINDDEDARYHFRQAMVLAVLFASVLAFLSIVLVFLSLNSRITRLVITILIYMAELAYFSACITGTVLIFKKRRLDIAVLQKYAGYINI